jgi:subtilisin family serine protease
VLSSLAAPVRVVRVPPLNEYAHRSLRVKRALLATIAGALVVTAPAAAGPGTSRFLDRAQFPVASNYVPGQVLVVFRAGASRGAMARANLRAGARTAQSFPGLRIELVRLAPGKSVQAAIRRYGRDSAVASAEPNYLRHVTADPLDELFTDQWDLKNTGQSHPVADTPLDGNPGTHVGTPGADIKAPLAWGTQKGKGTVVAVIDTGVDVNQPDLNDELWTNPGEIPGDGLDNDGNHKPDDVHGWDFANNDATLISPTHWEGFDHGTHVAGTIAAELNNSGANSGIVGVCPECKIMALKVARDREGAIPISAEVAALGYAKRKGAKIANMSLGGPDWSNAEREAIRMSGMLVVVAAGNDSLDNDMALGSDVGGSPSYPAAYTLPNILTVAASNDQDRYAYSTECFKIVRSRAACAFTNWGHDSVDVAAPGVDITSTVPGTKWETWDGTSMAAPHVAGVAGLVFGEHSTYTVAQVKNAIMNSVDKPRSLRTMYISSFGANGVSRTGAFTRTSGRVNAAAAVMTANTANATPLTDGNVNGARAMTRARVGGSVSWPADINDVRKRRLVSGHRYRIKLTVPTGEDYDLFVWKPGTKEIWQALTEGAPKLRAYSVHGGSTDEVVRFKANSTGTFFIHVSAWLFKSGKYTLSVKRLS